jgi:site-specific DNA recombinase
MADATESIRWRRLEFGLKSLVSSIYLDDLRDKTLRGLEGRALAGFATGGVPNVPPPRVHAKGRRLGWKDSTIRAILHNETYTGCWRYKTRQWRKVPGTNRRVPFRNDHGNTTVHQRPHLRIIDDPIWRDTQARLEQVRRFYTSTADGKPKGRALPGRATPYLFSSLLRCGVCDGYAKRGVCSNALSVRESIVRACLLDELRKRLVTDQGIAYARKRLSERLGELVRTRDAELTTHRQRFDKLKREAERLVDCITQGLRSDTITERLMSAERTMAEERRVIDTLERQSAESIPLPTPDQILSIALRSRAPPRRGSCPGKGGPPPPVPRWQHYADARTRWRLHRP